MANFLLIEDTACCLVDRYQHRLVAALKEGCNLQRSFRPRGEMVLAGMPNRKSTACIVGMRGSNTGLRLLYGIFCSLGHANQATTPILIRSFYGNDIGAIRQA